VTIEPGFGAAIRPLGAREHEGVLLVRKAGEMLDKLANPRAWQKGVDKK
jgi:hypothetical protein